MTTERLFIAIPLPEIVRRSLASLETQRRGFRWTPERNLHLTLKFIGDCTPDDRDRIEARLAGITVPEFPIEVAGLGLFPRKGSPRVLWAGVPKPHSLLLALHKRIDDTLFNNGFEPDRTRYTPHVTLARVREASPESVREFLKQHRSAGAPPFFAHRYALFRSCLSAGPPRYDTLWERTLE